MSGLQMKYFVLKPAGDDAYAKASRAALQAVRNTEHFFFEALKYNSFTGGRTA